MSGPRSQKIVNRRLQYRIILMVARSGLLVSLGALLCFKLLSIQLYELLMIGQVDHDMAMIVSEAVQQMSVYFSFLVILSVFLGWSTSLFISNRIAGPIFNITRVLDRHLAGEKDLKITIRGKDYFSELVERLNQVLGRDQATHSERKD